MLSGLDPAAAIARRRLFLAAADALRSLSPATNRPMHACCAPGRIELLGKHTDYAGGQSLLVAAEQGFCLLAARRDDDMIRIAPAGLAPGAFRLDPGLSVTTNGWSHYAATVIRRIARDFPGALCGADIAFASDLPPAAGMSSSSALMTGLFLLLSWASDLPSRPEYRASIRTPESLAAYAATIENGQSFGALAGDRGVGTFGGSEDHTAILCCEAGRISHYAFCPIRRLATMPVPEGYCFAIASSGVIAEKTGAAMQQYNRASGLVRTLVELWRRHVGPCESLAAAVAAAPDSADRVRELAARHGGTDAEALVRRLNHFLVENGRIIPAADALSLGDVQRFAEAVKQSQDEGERLLGNQVPQTVHLARSAREHGALAASAFGAGFGGSVWALVRAGDAAEFLRRWSAEYGRAFPEERVRAAFFTTQAGPPCQQWDFQTI